MTSWILPGQKNVNILPNVCLNISFWCWTKLGDIWMSERGVTGQTALLHEQPWTPFIWHYRGSRPPSEIIDRLISIFVRAIYPLFHVTEVLDTPAPDQMFASNPLTELTWMYCDSYTSILSILSLLLLSKHDKSLSPPQTSNQNTDNLPAQNYDTKIQTHHQIFKLD